MANPSPIFVAGTGRSGTSRIADIIGEHPLIHRIPMETHFLIDPGGLRDLADALTVRFDPTVGADALRRLTELLTVWVPGRRDDRGKTVPELVGENRYREALRQLWPRLIACTYDGPGGNDPRVVPRYYADRAELIAVLRDLVETMFGGAADDAGKPTWCEKTPYNLFAMDFLWEMVPQATIVHITRHPVAVLASHLDQPWAPNTVDPALAYLTAVYRRWLDWKGTADLTGRRYIEVKAEDLAADWPGRRRGLFERLGADDFPTPSTFQPGKLANRDDQFDAATRRHVEQTLGEIIAAMGY